MLSDGCPLDAPPLPAGAPELSGSARARGPNQPAWRAKATTTSKPVALGAEAARLTPPHPGRQSRGPPSGAPTKAKLGPGSSPSLTANGLGPEGAPLLSRCPSPHYAAAFSPHQAVADLARETDRS